MIHFTNQGVQIGHAFVAKQAWGLMVLSPETNAFFLQQAFCQAQRLTAKKAANLVPTSEWALGGATSSPQMWTIPIELVRKF